MLELDEHFWNERYRSGTTGWDIGYISTPLKEYIDQLEDTELRILIPGAGNGYEAEYLLQQGFQNVTVIDISRVALHNLSARVPKFPNRQLLHQDFFEHIGTYDLVLEQTFFCALRPELRPSYVKKMYDLLVPGGKLVGLLFNIPLNMDAPPYGGSAAEYRKLFKGKFFIERMETAYNSIAPRQGNELFIKLIKK
jgi:SAM-dependent methyltransferase